MQGAAHPGKKRRKDSMTDKLAVSQAKLGKALVSEAKKQHNAEQQQAIVEQVRKLLRALNEVEQAEKQIAERRKIFEGRLKAIESGKFKIDTRGRSITYGDGLLDSIG
jgi:hypothetical protein